MGRSSPAWGAPEVTWTFRPACATASNTSVPSTPRGEILHTHASAHMRGHDTHGHGTRVYMTRVHTTCTCTHTYMTHARESA